MVTMATPACSSIDVPVPAKAEDESEHEMSGVSSDESDSGSSGSMLTRTTYTRPRKAKKKILKKKKDKKDSFIKVCFGCDAQSEQWDEVQEYHRRQAPLQDLPRIKHRWGRPRKSNGGADGEQCYFCRRTIRSKVLYSKLRSSQMCAKLKDQSGGKRVQGRFRQGPSWSGRHHCAQVG